MESISQMPSMGVLQLHEGQKRFQLTRYAPSDRLAPFVKHYWCISWDLQESYYQDVIPNPCVNIVIEMERSGIYGVASSKYTKHLQGKGRVFGVKFKPGGFYPFIQQPIVSLTDQSRTVSSVFHQDADHITEALLANQPASILIERTEALLKHKLPEYDANIDTINQMILYVQHNKELTKVEQLCEAFAINIRKLQRLFNQYVGIGPKWVIQFYRLQNAAETLDNTRSHDWIKLSLELGYYDQSHFIKDFKSIIGQTPDQYIHSQISKNT